MPTPIRVPTQINALSGDQFAARIGHMATAAEQVRAETSEEDWARLEAQNALDSERFKREGIAGIIAHEPDPVAVRIRQAIKDRTDALAAGSL